MPASAQYLHCSVSFSLGLSHLNPPLDEHDELVADGRVVGDALAHPAVVVLEKATLEHQLCNGEGGGGKCGRPDLGSFRILGLLGGNVELSKA